MYNAHLLFKAKKSGKKFLKQKIGGKIPYRRLTENCYIYIADLTCFIASIINYFKDDNDTTSLCVFKKIILCVKINVWI